MMFAACSTEEVPESAPMQPNMESRGNPLATPVPVADLTMPNGNKVEFYDFGHGVLVSETGQAGTTPVLDKGDAAAALEKSAPGSDKLADLWKSLAPNQSEPASLKAIRQRWANQPAKPAPGSRPALKPEVSGVPMGPALSSSIPLGKVAAPVGCNNGCCDQSWLQTLSYCKLHYDYSWFLYNYGYSYMNANGIDNYKGLVCSASGTSTYKVNVSDGSGGTWNVSQATYRTFSWVAGIWDRDVKSSVNTSANQHLHTYCGTVSY
jgi:hypothetical protein